MSVKVHEPVCEDSAQDLYFWFDHFLGDQVKDEWRDTGNTGNAVVVDAQTGGIVRLTTGATTDDEWRIDWQDIRSLHVTKKVTMEARVKLTQTTQHNIRLALFFDANNYIMFYNGAGAGASNWNIYCRNVATTNFSSGVAIDTSYHIFRIEAFPTDEVHFYIDGVETAGSPITTNIPDDPGDYLQPYFYIKTTEDAIKSMDIDYVVVRQER